MEPVEVVRVLDALYARYSPGTPLESLNERDQGDLYTATSERMVNYQLEHLNELMKDIIRLHPNFAYQDQLKWQWLRIYSDGHSKARSAYYVWQIAFSALRDQNVPLFALHDAMVKWIKTHP